MKIIQGLASGIVMQRGENGCDIVFTAQCTGTLRASRGELTPLGENRYRFTGVPAGGPYRLVFADGGNETAFENVYVGDVWLLAGQSNMEGAGDRRPEDIAYDSAPLPQVRAYYMDGIWDAARSRLHQLWLLPDAGVREKHRQMNAGFFEHYKEFTVDNASGVGPGLYIARQLFARTGVPQGVIPCGFGGASLWDWSPENGTPASLYRSMLRRLAACGGRVRGAFWYQGESEAMGGEPADFAEKTEAFIRALRRDTGDPALPFVQAQLGPCTLPQVCNEKAFENWHRVQALQLRMATRVPAVGTVPAASASLQDMIHLDAASQEELGMRMADEMLRLVTGEGEQPPVPLCAEIYPHSVKRGRSVIALTFAHVAGALQSAGQPRGFSVSVGEETPYLYPNRYLSGIRLEGDRALLTVEDAYVPAEKAFVWYGAGFHSAPNVTDGAGRPLPVFGPMAVTAPR